jgi:hypothetical protein
MTSTIAAVDVALAGLIEMLTRAVNAPDLPSVKRFSERIDEQLEERWARMGPLERQHAKTISVQCWTDIVQVGAAKSTDRT